MEVIFEDNHLLVVVKPPNMLTQPSGTEQANLQDKAKAWLKEKYKKPGNVFLEPIHRLDKVAGGIVVFAKTSKALPRLIAEVQGKSVKKIYRAIVEPAPKEPSGKLTHYLRHEDHYAKVVEKEASKAQLAILHYKTLRKQNRKALLEIELITGRYHQIRAQLGSIGSPVAGDEKYGSAERWTYPGIALHHVHFEIAHPISKQLMIFQHFPVWGL